MYVAARAGFLSQLLVRGGLEAGEAYGERDLRPVPDLVDQGVKEQFA